MEWLMEWLMWGTCDRFLVAFKAVNGDGKTLVSGVITEKSSLTVICFTSCFTNHIEQARMGESANSIDNRAGRDLAPTPTSPLTL